MTNATTRNERATLRATIAANAVGADTARRMGVFLYDECDHYRTSARKVVFVVEYGMDCDGFERTSLSAMPANSRQLNRRESRMYDSAEGPCSLTIISAEDAAEFTGYTRDRVLEAYEDGHPWSI